MQDNDIAGKLVFLTPHLEVWLRELNSEFNVPLANRLSKIIKVFDWDTPEGQILLKEREKTGKWENLNAKDFKFVVKIYFPDLIFKEKKGITVEEVIPKFFPGSKKPMFTVVPEWMIRDINKEEKNAFDLVNKKENKDNTNSTTKIKNVSE